VTFPDFHDFAVGRRMIVNAVIEYLLANPSIIVAGIALCTLIVVLSIFLSSPKPGPNPFGVDRRKPPKVKDVVFDQALRDKVLKQGTCVCCILWHAKAEFIKS
jgi:hypothetical protein